MPKTTKTQKSFEDMLQKEKKKYSKRLKRSNAYRTSLVKKGFEDAELPIADWKYDVANGDTKLGYIDWFLHNIESHEGE